MILEKPRRFGGDEGWGVREEQICKCEQHLGGSFVVVSGGLVVFNLGRWQHWLMGTGGHGHMAQKGIHACAS